MEAAGRQATQFVPFPVATADAPSRHSATAPERAIYASLIDAGNRSLVRHPLLS